MRFTPTDLNPYHGDRRVAIAPSVLLSLVFAGVQWVVWVLMSVVTPFPDESVYAPGSTFVQVSAVTTGLLLAFVLGDLHRHRLESQGLDRYQYLTFGVAALLMALLLAFFVHAWIGVGP